MFKHVVAAVALASIAAPAFGQETWIRSVRVSAPDVAGTSAFYKTVFGLKEIRHEDREGALFEVIMNYGATVEAATASTAPKMVVIQRAKDAPSPSVSNLVFGVKDVDAVVARAVKAGGTASRPVNISKTSGSKIGFIKDPAGNEIELIQEKKG